MAKLSKIAVVFPKKTGPSEEKALVKVFDAIADAQKRVSGVLEDVGKTKPMPKALQDALNKRLVIAKGRAAEIKDLEKSAKRKELHTNPSKLERVMKDLNDDIAQANGLEGGIAKFMDDYYDGKIAELVKALVPTLPKGVSPGQIKLADDVVAFKKLNRTQNWAKYDANVPVFTAEVAEKARIASIGNLRDHPDFKELKQGTRDSIVNKTMKEGNFTAKQVKQALETALRTQKNPSKSRWANYLGLGAGGSYRLNDGGKFDGYKIHWTMSNDSWTPAADGSVDLTQGSAANVLSALLNHSTGAFQLHATLEIGAMSNYPHVYLYAGAGNAQKWRDAAAQAKIDKNPKNPKPTWEADWITAAQAELTKVLDDLKVKLTARIADAQRTAGSTF